MSQLVLILLTLVVLINRPISSVIVLADFQQQALDEHNYLRGLHCASLMILNSTLNTIAQNWSNYLATNNLFQHSNTPGLGENLFGFSSSVAITFMNGSTPTASWYSEISQYNYTSGFNYTVTGHFTQVVWNASIQLGIGVALSSNNLTIAVVANYYPPGNYQGAYPANVFPLCSNPAGGD